MTFVALSGPERHLFSGCKSVLHFPPPVGTGTAKDIVLDHERRRHGRDSQSPSEMRPPHDPEIARPPGATKRSAYQDRRDEPCAEFNEDQPLAQHIFPTGSDYWRYKRL